MHGKAGLSLHFWGALYVEMHDLSQNNYENKNNKFTITAKKTKISTTINHTIVTEIIQCNAINLCHSIFFVSCIGMLDNVF